MKDLPKHHPPICKDCKHFVKAGFLSLNLDSCTRFVDLVDGVPIACTYLRYITPADNAGICGGEGKYFEPRPEEKKSLWKRLLGKN